MKIVILLFLLRVTKILLPTLGGSCIYCYNVRIKED